MVKSQYLTGFSKARIRPSLSRFPRESASFGHPRFCVNLVFLTFMATAHAPSGYLPQLRHICPPAWRFEGARANRCLEISSGAGLRRGSDLRQRWRGHNRRMARVAEGERQAAHGLEAKRCQSRIARPFVLTTKLNCIARKPRARRAPANARTTAARCPGPRPPDGRCSRNSRRDRRRPPG